MGDNIQKLPNFSFLKITSNEKDFVSFFDNQWRDRSMFIGQVISSDAVCEAMVSISQNVSFSFCQSQKGTEVTNLKYIINTLEGKIVSDESQKPHCNFIL